MYEWVVRGRGSKLRVWANTEQEAAEEGARDMLEAAHGWQQEHTASLVVDVWTVYRPDIVYRYSVKVDRWWRYNQHGEPVDEEGEPACEMECDYPDTRLIDRRGVDLVDGVEVNPC